MITAMAFAVALNTQDLSYKDLERYYWDCDTAFMQGTMGGVDLNSCLAITDEFQKHFADRDAFIRYWQSNRHTQWNRRGFYPQKNPGLNK